jgi:hypothetical protein
LRKIFEMLAHPTTVLKILCKDLTSYAYAYIAQQCLLLHITFDLHVWKNYTQQSYLVMMKFIRLRLSADPGMDDVFDRLSC